MELKPHPSLEPLDSTDESLVWSLEAFQNHLRAVRFVRQFQSLLCVYSPRVQQLYGSYEVVAPRDHKQELVVFPDLFAFQDTWYRIPEGALQRTGALVVPGELVQAGGPHLRIPSSDGPRGRVVPLATGLRAMDRDYQQRGQPFLPVITKGDLRALRRKTPLLHLHRLELRSMGDKSRFELTDIAGTIRSRLRKLTGPE